MLDSRSKKNQEILLTKLLEFIRKEKYMKKIIKFTQNLSVVVIVFGFFAFSTGQALAVSAPDVISANAVNITSTGATLTGSVNPNGATTSAWFETMNGFESTHQNIGGGTSNVNLNSYTLTNLNPGTNYQFRIVAINAVGNTFSSWVSFTTQSTTPPPPPPSNVTVYMTASPSTIVAGSPVTISWTSTNATSCDGYLPNYTTNVPLNGSQVFYPTVTTTYNVSCTNSSGSVGSHHRVVTVTQPPQNPANILSFYASPNSVPYNGTTTLYWSVSNATSCTAGGYWSGNKNANGGSQAIAALVSNPTVFTLTCTGPGGSDTASTSVTVGSQPQNPPTVNLTASPTFVSYNGTTNLNWNVTNATSCTAGGYWSGSKNPNGGSQAIAALVSNPTVFTLTCTGPGGSASDSVSVSVGAQPQPLPTVNLSANPTFVNYNGTSTLSWNSTNATSCNANGGSNGWAGYKNTSGNFNTGNLTNTTTYTITCTGAGGSATDTVTVSVGNQPTPAPTVNLSANPTFVSYNGTTTLNWNITNATSCTATGGWSGSKNANGGSQSIGNLTNTTTFTLTCNGAGGSASDSVTVSVGAQPQNPPVITLSASPSSVSYNGSTTLTWSVTNATYCAANSTPATSWSGTQNANSGSKVVNNLTANPTYFNLYCTGPGGSDSQTVSVSVGSQPQPVPTVNLTASPSSIAYGADTTIAWNVTNATSCTATNGSLGWSGSKNPNGGTFFVNNLTNTTTYNITCTGPGGSASDSVTVFVGSQPISAPKVTLTASPMSVAYNGVTTLSWSVTDATSCTAGGYWSGNKNPNGGSQAIAALVTNPTVFTLTCTGPGGSHSDSVSVSVGAQPQPLPTVTLSANPTNVAYNGNSVLSWSTTNATSCVASGGWSGSKSVNGGNSTISNLTNTTTYVITCTNSTGSASDSVTVFVGTPPPSVPTVNLTANPINVSYNGASTISWVSTNATTCNATGGANGWAGSKNTNGSFAAQNLTNTVTFNITCTGAGGSVSDSVTVLVGSQPTPSPTVNISANPASVAYNGASTLTWTSTNATSCNATGGSNSWTGGKNTSGSFATGNLTSATTYTITCTNSTGSATDSVTVNVGSEPISLPTVNTNAANNIGTTYATLNGLVNSNGSTNISAWFEWGINSNYGNQTPKNFYGNTSSTNFNYALGGLQPNTTYYFRAAAQSNNGQIVYGSQMAFTTTGNIIDTGTLPNVTTYSASEIGANYATLNGYVNPNGYATTRWFEWSTTNAFLSNSTVVISQGTQPGNISQYLPNLSPNTIYYFRAAARNNYGTVYGNVLSFVTINNTIINPCLISSCTPTAITTLATNVGFNSARLNGLGLVNGTNVSTTGYFEWGTTQALGNTTNSAFIGSGQSNPFSQSLINVLQTNTTYFYRAVVSNQYGISRGDIVTFRTNGFIPTTPNTPNPSITYRETTLVTNTSTNTNNNFTGGISRPSLIFLTISGNNEISGIGGTKQYIVNYKNVSGEYLGNVVVTVSMPNELQFVQTTRGDYSQLNNTVVANIGNLAPQEEGSIMVEARTVATAEIGKIIVVTAHAVYTILRENAQEEVFAYSKNTIGNNVGGSIAGAAIFGGGFLPDTLAGWLLMLLIILLVVLAAKMAYNSTRPKTIVVGPSDTITHSHS